MGCPEVGCWTTLDRWTGVWSKRLWRWRKDSEDHSPGSNDDSEKDWSSGSGSSSAEQATSEVKVSSASSSSPRSEEDSEEASRDAVFEVFVAASPFPDSTS